MKNLIATARRVLLRRKPVSPLDQAPTGPTIRGVCADCGEEFPVHFHGHITPFGMVLHVEDDDIDLHRLTCTAREGNNA